MGNFDDVLRIMNMGCSHDDECSICHEIRSIGEYENGTHQTLFDPRSIDPMLISNTHHQACSHAVLLCRCVH